MRALEPLDAPDEGRAHPAALMMRAGGDGRIAIDPADGRNSYGVPPLPAPDEIWFSSSTASAVSVTGFRAARAAYERVLSGGQPAGAKAWFDGIRARILAVAGSPGAEAVLCASGTEAEFVALAVSRNLLRRPLTNIVIAPRETGSGVMHAAAGTHFDHAAALASQVVKGAPLQGLDGGAIATATVEIRSPDGAPRDPGAVDGEVAALVAGAVGAGRDILLHLLDMPKTGRSGTSRAAAMALMEAHPGRVVVVVDACQLGCPLDVVKADLEAGFLVMITGSKFAGGPPFCGALLVPRALAARLGRPLIPSGLAAYSARLDWPAAMRPAGDGGDFATLNLGLGLRWEAALADIEPYAALAPERGLTIARAFEARVRRLVAARRHLRFLDGDDGARSDRPPTLFPIVSGNGDPARALALHRAMRAPAHGGGAGTEALAATCHLGQPVVIGPRAALRVCLGMPTINDVAQGMDRLSATEATRPVLADLDLVFRKWDLLEQRMES